jgi:hypothetical protein
MAAGDIYLGVAGSEYKLTAFGRKFTIRDIELSREDRTASGRLVRDVIATKKEFVLNYETIEDESLETFLDLYELQRELNLIVSYNNSEASYTVLLAPIERERIKIFAGGLWGGVTITLRQV